ncbi:MAG TPA: FadR/GntR family transcriptional regulator [Patescibacteria group bacterium]|nr:FadR/GntR family transcriptional regulator [Patescibacteria group bacterium]
MEYRKQNTSDMVYKVIEEKILNQDWTPGTKITSENQLAQDLGVSRISVREAIEKMVALNVLTKKQGEGTFVNELSASIYLNGLIPMILLEKDNLIDILEFRRVIEVDSARLCAERCDEEDIELLEECYAEMYLNKDASENFAYSDYNFHMAIARGSGNSLIIKVNSILTDLWKFHQREINKYLGPKGGLHEHRKILDAIKDHDAELAALFMKRHIERTLNDIRKIKELERIEELEKDIKGRDCDE